jgi:hypothetical protein
MINPFVDDQTFRAQAFSFEARLVRHSRVGSSSGSGVSCGGRSAAFFQNCYHLRDWLLCENAMPQHEIEQLFKNNAELRICGDLCNATKHLALTFPKQREFSFGRAYCDPGTGRFGLDQSYTFTVMSEGKSYEFLSLADTLGRNPRRRLARRWVGYFATLYVRSPAAFLDDSIFSPPCCPGC